MPNLLVIGAPKCGTSTLHMWLSRHTRVFMAQRKEPAYFTCFREMEWRGPAAALFASALVESRDEYAALFSPGNGCVIVGESSTDYLWRPEAPDGIRRDIGGEARFVCILRNPVERAFSEHMHLVRDGYEERDFVEALDLEDRRFEQRWIPLFYHRRRSAYSEGLQRYFDRFGRDPVKVLIFEECFREPERTMRELTAFLGIPYEPCHTSHRINVSGLPRSRLLHRLDYRPHGLLRVESRARGVESPGAFNRAISYQGSG